MLISNRTFWKTLKPSWQMRVVWNDCISIEKDGDITRDEKVLVELFNENYINIVKISSGKKPSWTPPLAVHSWHLATKPLWWWEGWVHWIVFMTSLYMYYIPCFELVKHSVYIYIYQNKREFSLDKEFEWAYANAKDINQIIKYLIVNKAKGPDGTSAKFVKMSTDIIDYHIANVIIKDISDNKYSKNAKTATARPNFKKGDSTEIKNYTPVTLLNILTKTYKRFLHKNLTNYADTFLSKFILAYRKSYLLRLCSYKVNRELGKIIRVSRCSALCKECPYSEYLKFFVCATRRRRDSKISLCLSATVWKSFIK